MRFLACGIAALFILLPGAQAGSADDPEIEDSGSDAGGRDGMDLEAAWIDVEEPDEDDPVVRFTFKLAGDPEHVPAFFAAHEEFRLNFVGENLADAAEIYVSLRPTCSSTNAVVTTVPTCESETAACRVGMADVAGGYQELQSETEVGWFIDDGDQMGCTATYSQLGLVQGAVITDPYITHRLLVRGPLSSGDDVGPEVLEEFDRAPDTGFGRSFALPAATAGGALNVTYIEVEELPLRHEVAQPTAGILHYNWTGDAPLRILAQADTGNLSLDVTVLDSRVYSWNGTSLDHPLSPSTCLDASAAPEDCTYGFRFQLEGFVGSYSVDVAEEEDPADETEQPHVDEPADNATLEEIGPAKETPGMTLPLVVVALALVARRP